MPGCASQAGGGPGAGGVGAGVVFDAETVRGVAIQAARCGEDLRAALAIARPGMDAVSGPFRTVPALRSCASVQHGEVSSLAERIGAVSTKLTETISEYGRRDADLAARLAAILPS